jgi:hypothetical protein
MADKQRNRLVCADCIPKIVEFDDLRAYDLHKIIEHEHDFTLHAKDRRTEWDPIFGVWKHVGEDLEKSYNKAIENDRKRHKA